MSDAVKPDEVLPPKWEDLSPLEQLLKSVDVGIDYAIDATRMEERSLFAAWLDQFKVKYLDPVIEYGFGEQDDPSGHEYDVDKMYGELTIKVQELRP